MYIFVFESVIVEYWLNLVGVGGVVNCFFEFFGGDFFVVEIFFEESVVGFGDGFDEFFLLFSSFVCVVGWDFGDFVFGVYCFVFVVDVVYFDEVDDFFEVFFGILG